MHESIAKEQSGVKECLEIMTIRGEGGSDALWKNHLKFPFWLFEYLPYLPLMLHLCQRTQILDLFVFSPSHRKIDLSDRTSEKELGGKKIWMDQWIMNGQVPQLTFEGSVG